MVEGRWRVLRGERDLGLVGGEEGEEGWEEGGVVTEEVTAVVGYKNIGVQRIV